MIFFFLGKLKSHFRSQLKYKFLKWYYTFEWIYVCLKDVWSDDVGGFENSLRPKLMDLCLQSNDLSSDHILLANAWFLKQRVHLSGSLLLC